MCVRLFACSFGRVLLYLVVLVLVLVAVLVAAAAAAVAAVAAVAARRAHGALYLTVERLKHLTCRHFSSCKSVPTTREDVGCAGN